MGGLDGLGLGLAFASSAADACHEATQKALASYLPHPELALALKSGLIASAFFASYFQQQSDAWVRLVSTFSDHNFLLAWAVAGSINVGANFLMILGMKRGKMSDTVPFLSLSPVFLLVSGYFLLGELADGRGMFGVGVIAAGGFWLSRAGASDGEGTEEKSKSKGLPPGADIYIFIAMIQSVSSAFDKRGVRASPQPILYGATISATVAVFALLKFSWQQWKDSGEHAVDSLPAAAADDIKSNGKNPDGAARGPQVRQTSPGAGQSSMMRRRSSFMADLMASDIWEKCELPEGRSRQVSEDTIQESEEKSEDSDDSGLEDKDEKKPDPPPQPVPAQQGPVVRRRSSFTGGDLFENVGDTFAFNDTSSLAKKRQSAMTNQMSQRGSQMMRRKSSMFAAPDTLGIRQRASLAGLDEKEAETVEKEIKKQETVSFTKRWGLMLLACALKMTAYWCQLKANERIYSSHLSAIRKSGVLLVMLLGKVLFNEEIGSKMMPVATMLVGVAILAAK